MKYNTTIFLVIITLLSFACKKSKLNPHCWGEKEEGKLYYVHGCENRPIIELENNNIIEPRKIPSSLLPSDISDTINVFINYKKIKNGGGCRTIPCDPCTNARIRCIQKK